MVRERETAGLSTGGRYRLAPGNGYSATRIIHKASYSTDLNSGVGPLGPVAPPARMGQFLPHQALVPASADSDRGTPGNDFPKDD